MNELDTVVLRRAIPEHGLEKGDVGVVVHSHSADSFEVEFASGEGATLAVLTLSSDELRTIESEEILHVRSLAHP